MREIIKCMLASGIKDYDKITYPKYISAKLDGIRCIINNGVVYSRSGKPIRSKVVQQLFGRQDLNMLDGELIYGSPTADNVFNLTTSFVMSEDIPNGMDASKIKLYVFDYVNDNYVFNKRMAMYGDIVYKAQEEVPVRGVTQWVVNSPEEMLTLEQQFLTAGYEGAMLRNIHGLYKHGRATEKSQDLLKVKRFLDAEATVIGYEEEMFNGNEAVTNELGHTERSQHKENLVGKGSLGALVCLTKDNVEFKIGTGFDAAMRKALWYDKENLIGKIVKYKYFNIGIVIAPRLPVFLGWRDESDIS